MLANLPIPDQFAGHFFGLRQISTSLNVIAENHPVRNPLKTQPV
jgi:hypothetical protein